MQGNTSLYGFTKETLDSLMLTLLPPIGHKYQLVQDTVNEEMDIKVLVLQTLVDALRDNAGFHIPKVLLSHMITHLEYVVNTYALHSPSNVY